MNPKTKRLLERIYTFSPLAGILVASLLDLTFFQRQVLMLLLLIWFNAFIIYAPHLNS